MAFKDINIPFGINTLRVGRIELTTVRIRVNDTFPIKRLPKEIVQTQSAGKRGKLYYQLTYSDVIGAGSAKIIKKLGILLREHAQNQLDDKYAWVDTVYQGRR